MEPTRPKPSAQDLGAEHTTNGVRFQCPGWWLANGERVQCSGGMVVAHVAFTERPDDDGGMSFRRWQATRTSAPGVSCAACRHQARRLGGVPSVAALGARKTERAGGGAGGQAGAGVQRAAADDVRFEGLEGLLEPEQTSGVSPGPIAAKCARGVGWRRREHLPAAAPHPRVAAAIGSEPAPPTEGSVGDAWSSEEEECEEGPSVCPGCHAGAEACAPGCPDAARERELEAREYELDELDDDD